MIYAEHRSRLVKWIRKQLIGPASAEDLTKEYHPIDRYPTGTLFPIIPGEEGLDPADNDEAYADPANTDTNEDQEAQPTAKARRYTPPSSVGFSFYAEGEHIEFQAGFSVSRYRRTGERDEQGRFKGFSYERNVIHPGAETLSFTIDASTKRAVFNDRKGVLEGHGALDILYRPFHKGWIITISLLNKQQLPEITPTYKQQLSELTFFEVELRCFLDAGQIGIYPRVDKNLLSEEEQELELQYKHRHIYAVGHGAAVDWREEKSRVREIWADFIPAVEVPQVTADTSDDQALSLFRLTQIGKDSSVLGDLQAFVEGYAVWIMKQKEVANTLDPDEAEPAGRILKRMQTTQKRMQHGVAFLLSNATATQAFRITNQAMLDQMQQSDQIAGKTKGKSAYRWRPFQLAFLLTVIESSAIEDNNFRDTVDLIWFPTGGGKTEAYLGLLAFLIVWRRLKHTGSYGGTAVLMRYTLRLLTTQQFTRATKIICALELIRRRHPELGDEPITVGMWVGEATSSNTYTDALKSVQRAAEGHTQALRRLVLLECPWCGEDFRASNSYISNETTFHFQCTNQACAFGGGHDPTLPCNVVDEALYEKPPTLLFATVDKLARLAWDERSNTFFGINGNKPPELIIQDELHLIAGALGSIAGLYEAALDSILINKGVYPKYIASTATIRMAADQIKKLYGRDLAVFPPPGLSCDDNYFARTVPLDVRPGRLYLGYLAPALNRQKCLAPLAAALHIAPEALFSEEENREALLDAWWTMIVYHGSLKGVGNTHNAYYTEIRNIVERLKAEYQQSQQQEQNRYIKNIQRPLPQIAQLTSISTAEENAQTFSRLALNHEHHDSLDVALATNMVSVGLDVSRLALMVINGQPLTTAEYIQASSRVGRSDVPGLVITNFYRDQARSLSHYENFRAYHDAFYRFVEPTSITPYTHQARSRALHAALVIMLRHSFSSLLEDRKADRLDPDTPEILQATDRFFNRCRNADPERADEVMLHLHQLMDEWKNVIQYCHKEKLGLAYRGSYNDRSTYRLLYTHDDKIKGLWATLNSMRNVENTAFLKPL